MPQRNALYHGRTYKSTPMGRGIETGFAEAVQLILASARSRREQLDAIPSTGRLTNLYESPFSNHQRIILGIADNGTGLLST